MAETLIDLSGVGMTYEAASGPVEALAGISLAVGAGEFVSLVGPSGCGKSTLLRIVAGLRAATVGTVTVGGHKVIRPIPDIGMVFQAPILLKWRTILDNVLLPAELAGKGNVVMMPWADFGFDMYSMSIMASEKTMKDKPKQLRDFLEASYMGWRDVMADPKAAMEILKKRVPEVDVEVMTPNMLIGLGLMKTDRYAKNGIGWIDEKKMCDSVDLVNTYMGLPKKVECKAVYSTDFFTKVEMPK